MRMEVAGAPIWSHSLEKFSLRMEESTKRIVDNLQRNLEKYIDGVFSPIFSSMKLELEEMEEELEEEENQADLMEGELPEEIHAGEKLLPDTFSIGEGGIFNPHMVATSLRAETSKEELEDLKNTIVSYTLSDFGGGLHGGPIGWGGFYGGEYKATGGKTDFPLPWMGGRRGDFAGGFTGGGLGDIVGDLGGGYCGLAGAVHSDLEGVFAGKAERGGKTTVGGGLNREEVFVRGRSGASLSGGGPGKRACGGDFLGGEASWDLLQNDLETMEYGRSYNGSFVGLERRMILENVSKGICVISQISDIMAEGVSGSFFSYQRGERKEMGQIFVHGKRPISETDSSQPILSNPANQSYSSPLTFQPTPIFLSPTQLLKESPRSCPSSPRKTYGGRLLSNFKNTRFISSNQLPDPHYLVPVHIFQNVLPDDCYKALEQDQFSTEFNTSLKKELSYNCHKKWDSAHHCHCRESSADYHPP